MIHQRDIAILTRLLTATIAKLISWRKTDNEWYSCNIAGREISFRLLYYEATNQVGADPFAFDFTMPGRNARFACGTQGFDLLTDILESHLNSKKEEFDPLAFLDDALSRQSGT